ncbi:restriction endonuclease subunit S [Staphylococcus cohnii]|uniref:restriction endonuclease subunit S n=1 Tax=Staphylococcus cohnii TaxID=29382 RepID=UPI003D7F1813
MEFKEYKIGELVEYKNEKLLIENVNTENYISTENLLPNRGGKQAAGKLPNAKSVKKYDENDVLISNIRPYFKKIWQAESLGGASNDVLILNSNSENLSNDYLYYYLSQDKFFDYMTQTAKGTKMPRGDKKAILDYKIKLPNTKEVQDYIADLGKNIDKKIETNKNIIANLEELSQTLFKHWFVDFEFPDENDNPYKSSGGEMIDSELGEIPERWSLGNFENLGKIVGGGTPSKKVSEYYTKQKEIPWITPKDLSKNKNTYIYHGEQDITELGLNKSSAKLINKDSVLFSSRAPIGYIAIAGQEVTTNQGFKSIEVDKNINPYYVFFLLKYKLPIIEQTASGSTFKEISGKGMKSIPIILPIIETINKYGNIVESYFEKIKVLEKENQKLIQLRNTLLPKLMSGEIEIPDDIEVNEDELSI